jgi:hypothetical protein
MVRKINPRYKRKQIINRRYTTIHILLSTERNIEGHGFGTGISESAIRGFKPVIFGRILKFISLGMGNLAKSFFMILC